MKLLEEAFTKGGGGHVRLVPDNPEDMWHVYNLIRVDDHVDAVTFRKVTRGGGDEHAGAAESERVRVRLRLRVEDVAYDGEGDAVRVKGRNTTETDSVKLGAYHTITLEPNRPVKIEKVEWDVLDVDRVRELSDPAATADLAVLLITEGLANLALVGASVTTFKAKVEKAMPRKSGAAQMGYAKALETFHRNVVAAVERCVDFAKVKCVVVAGPGFAKDAFMRHVDATLARTAGGGSGGDGITKGVKGGTHTQLASEHRRTFVECHASTAFRGALREVLENPAVVSLIADTKAAAEVRALDDFFETLADRPDRALYGPAHVLAAHDMLAIDVLLITDAIFRTRDPNARRRWARTVDEVRGAGGKVHVFSAAHASGEQLGELTGVAATLRFPLPDLVDAELPPPQF